jgi:hypothetical protein
MNTDVVYVTRTGCSTEREHDPLVIQLRPVLCVDISAPPEKPLLSVAGEISAKAVESRASGHRVVVIISAFLDWETEGVKDGVTWSPGGARLRALTAQDTGGTAWDESKRMRSIKLMWLVWERLCGHAKILFTTDGVLLTRRSERAIEIAISAGRASRMYNWHDAPLVIEDVLMETLGVIA